MKTDLKKILSISGEQGLWQFVSQAKNGIIAESLLNKTRKTFGMSAKVTSLSDISIYTEDEEVSLRNVLEKMKEKLADAAAPDPKAENKVLVSFFEGVIPEYDHDRFYASHMKKVVSWYNILKDRASLDFADPEEEEKSGEKGEKEETKEEKKAEKKPAAKKAAEKSAETKEKKAAKPADKTK